MRPGVAFHLITRHTHDDTCDGAQLPEIKRIPLERLVLTIKRLGYKESAAAVCARLLDPPERASVGEAVRSLVAMEAIDQSGGGEELTPLGAHLACLPTDARLGKFILLGAIFGVVDEALTIAATLSHRTPFIAPFDKRDAADAAKRSFSVGQSDHLAALNAYRQFDSLPGNGKYDFARANFLGIKSLQTIGQLKRQLLELLSDAGFVRPGLRARAVEAAGRRAGGTDGVEVAVRLGLNAALASPPPPQRRGGGGGGEGDGGSDRLGVSALAAAAEAANQAMANGALVKALLCAALYPQVVLVESKEKDGGKGGGKGGGGKGGGGAPKFLIREAGVAEPVAVALHPSSVNARETRFESKYLVFAEKVKTTQIYVRDSSPVSPYALMLFGGGLTLEGAARGARDTPRTEATLAVDTWIRFRVPYRMHELILDIRQRLRELLMKKIERPEVELSAAGKAIMEAVTALLGTPPPDL